MQTAIASADLSGSLSDELRSATEAEAGMATAVRDTPPVICATAPHLLVLAFAVATLTRLPHALRF